VDPVHAALPFSNSAAAMAQLLFFETPARPSGTK
jgi:hypothetical protein